VLSARFDIVCVWIRYDRPSSLSGSRQGREKLRSVREKQKGLLGHRGGQRYRNMHGVRGRNQGGGEGKGEIKKSGKKG